MPVYVACDDLQWMVHDTIGRSISLKAIAWLFRRFCGAAYVLVWLVAGAAVMRLKSLFWDMWHRMAGFAC